MATVATAAFPFCENPEFNLTPLTGEILVADILCYCCIGISIIYFILLSISISID